jgi:polyisoprenoid-binding protein YceI
MRAAWVAIAGLIASTASPASAAHWTVDTAHSKLGFTVIWSKEPFSAAFQNWKAEIDFDPANLATAKADVTISLASEASDEPDFDSGLKGGIGFDAGKFPTAHFVATRFTHKSGNDYVADGTLTLKGVTKPISLPFTLTINGKSAHMVGTASVKRNLYGVGNGQWAAPDPVALDVKVNIDLVATQN